MSRVTILTGNHLCHNPRVVKEGAALARAGYYVTVLGAWFDRTLKERDAKLLPEMPFLFTPVLDAADRKAGMLAARIRSKAGAMAHRFAGVETRLQLGYAHRALSRAAARVSSDLYIAHSEAAMAVAVDLQREGCRVGIDMEDWFSTDLPPDARRRRPVRLLRSLERRLLSGSRHATCPSHAMSEALAKEFECPAPAIVYNAFPWSDRKSIDYRRRDRQDRRLPSVHWFSQTLGRSRGLEDLLAALPLMQHEAELHLRGNPVAGFEEWLVSRLPERWRGRLVVHRLVPNAELLSRVAEHDIGFAGETPSISSKNLTISNKILYYLLAGLAVVASDTAGQREVARQSPGAVFLYPSGDAPALAARLDALLESATVLSAAKGSALAAAERTFCWERQEKALLSAVAGALNPHEKGR